MSASPSEFSTIRATVSGVRGDLVLAQPDRLNAIDLDTLDELIAAARWFDSQAELRVVVVRGEGRAFSAGADLRLFSGGAIDAADPRHAADLGRRMADALEAMTAVTIAAIQGHCVGGGVVLAAACDLRIAATDATFSIPEVDLGLPLGWGGIPRLVREIGPALTKELVMTCRPFGADEALHSGFLNRVVAPDELDQAVDELASAVAAKPRRAVQATKRHTNAVAESMVGTGRSWADADGLLAAFADPEVHAAMARYLERSGRQPG